MACCSGQVADRVQGDAEVVFGPGLGMAVPDLPKDGGRLPRQILGA